MSRANDLRDAVAKQLQTLFSGYVVDAVVEPIYESRTLLEAPRIFVRTAAREIAAAERVHERMVAIQVGVIAAVPTPDTESIQKTSRIRHEREATDKFDDLFESVLAKWTPAEDADPILTTNIAEHNFRTIEIAESLDPSMYREQRVWCSTFAVNYYDSKDE